MSAGGYALNVPHITLGQSGDKIITPFGPMVYQTFLSDEQIDLFLQEGNRTPMNEQDYNFKLFSRSFIDQVSPIILDKASSFVRNAASIFSMALPSHESLSVRSMWINYQKQYDTVPMHNHFSLLQFVIYCDVPQRIFEETGRHNPMLPGRVSLNYGENISSFSNESFLITPQKNMMIIFPGKLNHLVYPFYSDDTRISVAGEIETSNEYKL